MTDAAEAGASDQSALIPVRFEVTVDGHSLAVFSELVSISSAVEVVDAISASPTETILKKLPGKRTPPTVTLKRVMSRNIEMAAWHELVILGDIVAARKTCSLTMFNAKGLRSARRGGASGEFLEPVAAALCDPQ